LIEKAITVYTLIDDILKTSKHQEDKRRTMSDSEVITTVLIAAMLFAGNIEKARGILSDWSYLCCQIRLCRKSTHLRSYQSLFFILALF
jgi:hypothetical protein